MRNTLVEIQSHHCESWNDSDDIPQNYAYVDLSKFTNKIVKDLAEIIDKDKLAQYSQKLINYIATLNNP